MRESLADVVDLARHPLPDAAFRSRCKRTLDENGVLVMPRTRMLAVPAYNTRPGISLSKSARMTFYGRLGA